MGWQEDNEEIRRKIEASKAAKDQVGLHAMAQAILATRNSCELACSEACQRVATNACGDLSELAHKFPGLKGKFAQHARVQLGWDTNGELMSGSVRVERPGGSIYMCNFQGDAPSIIDAAERATFKALMRSVSSFGEGLDIDMENPEACECAEELAFLKAAREAGGACGRFVKICAKEAVWAEVRNTMRWELENMLSTCARAGLVPRELENASLYLDEGEPGHPTWLVGFDVKRSLSFSSGKTDLLSSRAEVMPCSRGVDAERSWELPPLDAGFDAVWEALAKKVAAAQARGWPSLGRIVEPELVACEARAEVFALKEHVGDPVRGRRRPGL